MATNKANDTPTATPDNTPVPGGGRWLWDITLPGWVEVADPTDSPTPVTTASTQE